MFDRLHPTVLSLLLCFSHFGHIFNFTALPSVFHFVHVSELAASYSLFENVILRSFKNVDTQGQAYKLIASSFLLKAQQ